MEFGLVSLFFLLKLIFFLLHSSSFSFIIWLNFWLFNWFFHFFINFDFFLITVCCWFLNSLIKINPDFLLIIFSLARHDLKWKRSFQEIVVYYFLFFNLRILARVPILLTYWFFFFHLLAINFMRTSRFTCFSFIKFLD